MNKHASAYIPEVVDTGNRQKNRPEDTVWLLPTGKDAVEQEEGQEVPAGVGMRGGFPGRWNSKCKGPEAWGRGSEKPALAAIE